MRIVEGQRLSSSARLRQNAAGWDNRKVFNILRATARIRRQEQGTGCGRRVGRRAAARTAAENLSALTGLYLYQTVHLARGRARNVAGHIAVLDAASRELFGRPTPPPQSGSRSVSRRSPPRNAIRRACRASCGIELDPDGTERLLPAGCRSTTATPSEPSARSRDRRIRPDALPRLRLPRARGRSAAGPQAGRTAGAREVAVRCDSERVFSARPTTRRCWPSPAAPDRRSPVPQASNAAWPCWPRAAGLELRERTLRTRRPPCSTNFSSPTTGRHLAFALRRLPLMTFVAERIAEAMEGLFPKK